MRYIAMTAALALTCTGCDQVIDAQMSGIHDKVATDMVQQYDIAKESGTAIDRCVQAGMVSAAYLQAEDRENYATWKAVEKADCSAAGLKR